MIIKNLLHASESYTHDHWVFRNVFVGFSRLYYIIDGEAYYEENGRKVRLKKGYLYLTPVRKSFNLYENPQDKLLHTYSHITTFPAVTDFMEIKVVEGTPLADAVALYRKYIHTEDTELLMNVIQFLLSCISKQYDRGNTLAEQTKIYINQLEDFSLDMERLSRDMGYTREHITRNFLTAYRLTPMQYFNQKKMNIALTRLLDGEKVGEVAGQLNYSSAYAFSKAFKKYFGLSPNQYLLTLKTK